MIFFQEKTIFDGILRAFGVFSKKHVFVSGWYAAVFNQVSTKIFIMFQFFVKTNQEKISPFQKKRTKNLTYAKKRKKMIELGFIVPG